MKLFKACIGKSALFFLFFLVLTGLVYTLFMTGIAQLFFPYRANGSIIEVDGKKYSMLLGQTYTQDKYLWGRIQDYDFAVSSQKGTFYGDSSAADNFFGNGVNSNWIPHSHGKDEILVYSWASNASPAGDAKKAPRELARDDDNFPIGGEPNDGLIKQAVEERVARIREANRRNGITNMDNVPIPVALVTNSGSGVDPHIPPAAAHYQVPRIAAARGISEARVREIIDLNTNGRIFGFLGEPTVHVLKVNLMLDGASAEQVRAGKLN